MQADEIVARLKALANPESVKGMARYGINPEGTLGVSIPNLRRIAKEAGRDHRLAAALWKTGIHEARILAAFVDDPQALTVRQMDRWAADFDSWDVCDQCCTSLFDQSELAWERVVAWSTRDEEFVKRAAFATIAGLAWHHKTAPDAKFRQLLPIIKRESTDERNYVKKSVSWALRHIGKRNLKLNAAAITAAEQIGKQDSKAARWISRDALRELTGEAVQNRLRAAARKK